MSGESGTLDREQEQRLVRRWQQQGDREARERLVRHLEPRARAIASRYFSSRLSREDLAAEGILGLLVGIDRFDPDRGVRLMTYASHWVRAYVVKAVLKSWARGKTRTGVTRSRIFFKLRRELAKHSNLHREKKKISRALAVSLDLSQPRVEEMLEHIANPDASIEAIAQGQNPDAPEIQLPASDPLPDEIFFRSEQQEVIRESVVPALRELGERERMLVDRRYFQEDPPTLAELGREMGVSRERSRQIVQRALQKMARSIEQNHPDARKALSG